MGKAKRKINKLERKKKKQEIKPRIPVAPPSIAMKSKKDYNRKKIKEETKKMVKDDGWYFFYNIFYSLCGLDCAVCH